MANHTHTLLLKLNRFLFFTKPSPSPSFSIIHLSHKLNQFFPPKTWQGRLISIAAVYATVFLLCCCHPYITNLLFTVALTCRSVLTWLWVACCSVVAKVWALTCACCAPPMKEVMMTAPGTTGLVISRTLFESDPEGHFHALRANALVVRAGVVSFPQADNLFPKMKQPWRL